MRIVLKQGGVALDLLRSNETMRMMRNLKSWNAALCVALWALAVGSQAQTPTAGLNLLANPDFQTTGWGIAPLNLISFPKRFQPAISIITT
jgi:hypothetical protein